jgi:hypothetical protein
MHMTVEELETGFRELLGRVYDDDFVDQRRRRFLKRRTEIQQEEAVRKQSA